MNEMNRWVEQQQLLQGVRGTVIRFANECRTVKEATIQRSQLVSSLTSLITQIQNANLGEFRIRQINDEINRLLRQKYAFEVRIKQLGGPDFTGLQLEDGMELPGRSGYLYFGSAKNLPDVREVLGSESLPSRVNVEIDSKQISADYYGFRDEVLCETLLEDEAVAEIELRTEGMKRFAENRSSFARVKYDAVDDAEIQKMILEKKRQLLLQKYS